MLNEFFLYVLEDFHTSQSLGALKTSVPTLHLSRRRSSVGVSTL